MDIGAAEWQNVRPAKPRILKAKVSQPKHTARFTFTATRATGYRCALVRVTGHHKAKPHFKTCSSPKSYRRLRKGAYRFKVEGFNSAGTGPVATRSFRIA